MASAKDEDVPAWCDVRRFRFIMEDAAGVGWGAMAMVVCDPALFRRYVEDTKSWRQWKAGERLRKHIQRLRRMTPEERRAYDRVIRNRGKREWWGRHRKPKGNFKSR